MEGPAQKYLLRGVLFDTKRTMPEERRRVRRPYDPHWCNKRIFRAYRLLMAAKFPGLERNYAFERSCMTPATRENNRLRARNRYKFLRLGLVKAGDGTEIHHVDGNPRNNRMSNLRVVPRAAHTDLHVAARRAEKRRAP